MTNWQDNGIVTATQDSQPNIQQRYNPNIPYAEKPEPEFSPRHKVIYLAVKKAIDSGWQGWRVLIQDVVTVGNEAEDLVKQMIKYQKPLEILVYNKDFNYFLWVNNEKEGNWRYHLQQMVICDDVVKYLEENI